MLSLEPALSAGPGWNQPRVQATEHAENREKTAFIYVSIEV